MEEGQVVPGMDWLVGDFYGTRCIGKRNHHIQVPTYTK